MASEALQREIIGMRESDIDLLVEFARFLKYRQRDPAPQKAEVKTKKRQAGFLSDVFISMAPDFDETPECMEEYLGCTY